MYFFEFKKISRHRKRYKIVKILRNHFLNHISGQFFVHAILKLFSLAFGHSHKDMKRRKKITHHISQTICPRHIYFTFFSSFLNFSSSLFFFFWILSFLIYFSPHRQMVRGPWQLNLKLMVVMSQGNWTKMWEHASLEGYNSTC